MIDKIRSKKKKPNFELFWLKSQSIFFFFFSSFNIFSTIFFFFLHFVNCVSQKINKKDMRVAISTILFNMNPQFHCRVRMWCASAHRLNRDVFDGNASIVIIREDKKHDCEDVGAITLDYDPLLVSLTHRFAATHKTNNRMSFNTKRQHKLLLKWQIFNMTSYDRVLFLDSDIDPYFNVKYSKDDFSFARSHFYNMQEGVIYAHADHESPINTGILAVTPNASLYRIGLGILHRNKFNITHGFDFAGQPSTTIKANRKIKHSRCIRQNTWQFVCSDSDQGFFSHVMYVRKELKVKPPAYMAASHFWGWAKPFQTAACPLYKVHAENTLSKHDDCVISMQVYDTNKSNTKRCFLNHKTHLL